jgi:hypothetical protein
MNKLTVLILSKSYKPNGRCIAGRLVKFIQKNTVQIGNWVRPILNDASGCGAITKEMYEYKDGSEVKILDIVEIPIIQHYPIEGQPENYIIDKEKSWQKIGRFRADNMLNIIEDVVDIWHEQDTPSNMVTANYDQQGLIKQSLYLIKPLNLQITLTNEYDDFNQQYKQKIIANFNYKGITYENISITCPSTRRILTNQYPKKGEKPISMQLNKKDNYILCLSLSPRFGNKQNHYKLVATVFDFDGYLQREYSA